MNIASLRPSIGGKPVAAIPWARITTIIDTALRPSSDGIRFPEDWGIMPETSSGFAEPFVAALALISIQAQRRTHSGYHARRLYPVELLLQSRIQPVPDSAGNFCIRFL